MGDATKPCVLVCVNRRLSPNAAACGDAGRALLPLLREALDQAGMNDVPVEEIECFGYCDLGPNVRIAPGGAFFHAVSEAEFPRVMDALLALKA